MPKIFTAILFSLIFSTVAFAAADQVQQAIQGEFKKIDSNVDGFITPEEMEAYQAARFDALDKDKNASIDPQEVSAGTSKVLSRQSVNKITKEESSSAFKQYFDRMDRDNDNKISEAEYTDYWKAVYNF